MCWSVEKVSDAVHELVSEAARTNTGMRLFRFSRSAVANVFSAVMKMGAKSVTLEAQEVGPLSTAGDLSYERGEYVFYDSDQKQFDIGK